MPLKRSTTSLFCLAAWLCLSEPVAGSLVPRDTPVVSLTAPLAPAKGHQIVDAAFQSYSIEFNYMLDYAGNSSHPNKFSYQILKNLGNIAGAYPIIRVGGTTQNRAVYLSNQTEVALNQTFSRPWDDQPSKLTIGPKWFDSFHQFPKGTKYIYGLNFYTGEWGINNTVTQGTDAYLSIGKDLYAYEIGNEPNGWAGSSRRPANWTIYDYINEWTQYSEALRDEIRKHPGHETYTPQIQGCAFTAPRKEALSTSTSWNVANVVRLGMGDSEMLKTVADHDYMGANCVGAPIPTLEDNLLNHHRMTSLMYYHEVLGNQLEELGVPYVLGETNSISCQGTRNVSDVYGAALWAVDYVLYVAGLKVSRLYFHMGSTYRYAPWQPVTVNGTAPFAKPLYYGNLFAAKALAGGNKQVVSIANETTFAAYGIYNAKGRTPKLESVVVLNLDMFNSTQPASERTYKAVTLPTEGAGVQSWNKAKVRRLTAPGVEVKTGVTFAGQSVDGSGKLVGKEKVESVKGGEVVVGAGEAVLVTL